MTATRLDAAWWPHTGDRRIASYRLRCEQVVSHLQRDGLAVGLYRIGAAAPRCLVLSKRYDAASIDHALTLTRSAGTQLVLDLCDNHFHVADPSQSALLARAVQLEKACAQVGSVVCASAALAYEVRARVPDCRIDIIADAAEPPYQPGALQALGGPAHWMRLWRLRAWLRRQDAAPGRRLVWFGNHGSPGVDGGMQDIAMRRDAIEQAAAASPLTLTVISNSESIYQRWVRPLRVPSFYLPWNEQTFSAALRLHAVAVLPISVNPFTRCKTANRIASAALHGLNVVADSIPSYEPFADGAVLDHWHYGLGDYLLDAAQRQRHLATLTARIEKDFSLPTIAALWRRALGLEQAQQASALGAARG